MDAALVRYWGLIKQSNVPVQIVFEFARTVWRKRQKMTVKSFGKTERSSFFCFQKWNLAGVAETWLKAEMRETLDGPDGRSRYWVLCLHMGPRWGRWQQGGNESQYGLMLSYIDRMRLKAAGELLTFFTRTCIFTRSYDGAILWMRVASCQNSVIIKVPFSNTFSFGVLRCLKRSVVSEVVMMAYR